MPQAWAQLAVPPLSAHVVDQTGTLSNEQKASLEQTLSAFEARKGTQLAVLIVSTTQPEAIDQFSLRVAEQWKLGRKKVDDGVILVVAKNDRALRIEVGYGLEGALNDATSKRIISEVVVPRFQQQDFAGGIAAGVDQIIRVADNEALPAPQAKDRPGAANEFQQFAPVVFIVALGLGGLLRAWLGRLNGALVTAGVVTAGTWILAGTFSLALVAGGIALAVSLGGGMGLLGMRGRGGGGGFGGGGGGFGGGGASGRW